MGLEIEKWDFIFGSKCGDLKIRDFWDWYFGRGFGVCYGCVLCIVLMLVYACESLFM